MASARFDQADGKVRRRADRSSSSVLEHWRRCPVVVGHGSKSKKGRRASKSERVGFTAFAVANPEWFESISDQAATLSQVFDFAKKLSHHLSGLHIQISLSSLDPGKQLGVKARKDQYNRVRHFVSPLIGRRPMAEIEAPVPHSAGERQHGRGGPAPARENLR